MELRISLAQMKVWRGNLERNLSRGEEFIAEAARRGSQLVCLPEMWPTGFDWNYIESHRSSLEETAVRAAAMARRHGIWVNGTMPLLDNDGNVANTSILFNDRGERAATYGKIHLFSPMNEDRHLAGGSRLTVVNTPWGLTGLSVCYDIRFPELFRSYALKGAKLILSPIAFPHPRLEHWRILVRARAIENQLFMAGINQVGCEEPGIEGTPCYFGHSVLVDPWGRTVLEAGDEVEVLLSGTINLDMVDEIRGRLNVLKDRRPELYELK